MIFYKNLFYSVILSAFLLLGIIAYVMYKQNATQLYPPTINSCPDYYAHDPTGICIANDKIWTDVDGLSSLRTNLTCNNVDFSGNKVAGMSKKSSLCSKKQWAEDCGVTWDGVTDNRMLCYSEYVEST
jgi:hypothetical protein